MPGALAIVQARMASTRLPGKSLADLGGEPALALLLGRLSRARSLKGVVVATTVDAADDALEHVARAGGAAVHRGPREDVLRRFAEAARGHPGALVRVTGDCPLVDPLVVDRLVGLFEASPQAAYASNLHPRTYPRGLDVEVLSPKALAHADAEATEPRDREHVTLFLRRDPVRFARVNLTRDVDMSRLSLTIDDPEDLALVRGVVTRLGERRYAAGTDEIIAALAG